MGSICPYPTPPSCLYFTTPPQTIAASMWKETISPFPLTQWTPPSHQPTPCSLDSFATLCVKACGTQLRCSTLPARTGSWISKCTAWSHNKSYTARSWSHNPATISILWRCTWIPGWRGGWSWNSSKLVVRGVINKVTPFGCSWTTSCVSMSGTCVAASKRQTVLGFCCCPSCLLDRRLTNSRRYL